MTTHQFTDKFRPFALEGDTISTEIDGFTITATIARDHSGEKPEDRDDGFWPSKKRDNPGYVDPEHFDAALAKAQRVHQAWCNDEWFYCGIVLSVSRSINIPLCGADTLIVTKNAASLWGIECNYPDSDNSYLTETANELISEALDYAKAAVKQLINGVKL